MTWTKLSDDFADDCWALSDKAFRLHVEGLTWSNRKLLDLRIPRADVRRFAKHPEAVEELVDVGWWTRDGEHYVIRHHAVYQRDKETTLALQQRNQQNGQKGGRPKKPPREQWQVETQETQLGSQMETHQETQGDRPGQAQGLKEVPTEQVPPLWPPIVQPGTARLCRVCGHPLDSKLDEDTHPSCDGDELQARRAVS